MKFIDGYYAKDNDGAVCWYEELPEKGQSCWESIKGIRLLSCIQIDGPWEESIHKVENGKITRVQIYRYTAKTRRYWLVMMEKPARIADGIEGITRIIKMGTIMCSLMGKLPGHRRGKVSLNILNQLRRNNNGRPNHPRPKHTSLLPVYV